MATPENNSKDSNVKSTIDAVTGLAKAVPIYNDAVQPAAKEIGKSLATVTKTINIALAPISALVWGYDKISEFVQNRVAEKLKDTPEENIVTPDPAVVGPALEALRYTGNNETLRELYANLIANSMDKDTVTKAHPGFVEIIKNMTADEGLILKVFHPNIYKPIVDIKLKIKNGKGEHNLVNNYSNIGKEAGCQHEDLTPQYVDNLCRLGLLHIPAGRHLVGENAYDILLKTEEYEKFIAQYETEHTTTNVINKYIELTELGAQFRQACVIDKK
ncbi:MAG: DUF4393 domain-containing protein [Sphingobacteriales bacterium JAD_PAG50586_3]|nr:MAG: DUF4393 domain-containing protein [Sphingobacteriales bacterium JAD_PAG50586_3]